MTAKTWQAPASWEWLALNLLSCLGMRNRINLFVVAAQGSELERLLGVRLSRNAVDVGDMLQVRVGQWIGLISHSSLFCQ